MALNISKVIMAGRLTRDPELKNTTTGKVVANTTLAINRKWKDDKGELKEEATFVDVSAFGRTAEFLSQYFHKGSAVYLEGRLRQETWEDKTTGQKRSKLSVVVDNAQFAESAKAERSSAPADPERAYVPPPALPVDEPELPSADDVPF